MKSFGIIAASALFSAIVSAAPVNKRAVVWVTETEVDVVTVPVTMTVWAGEEKAVKTHSRHHFSQTEASTTSSSVVPTSTSNSSVYVAPTTSSSSVYVAPTTSSSSVYVAPTTSSTSTSVYVAPTTSSTSSSVYVAPTTSSTSVYEAPTSTYVAPTTSSTSVYEAPTSSAVATTSTSSAAAAATSSSSSGSTTTGMAASGTEYSGDLTWYDVGLGACGLTSVDGDHIVAISKTIFDAYSTGNPNTNPLCGQYVSITGKDGSAYKAKVVDRCEGCAEADLDLSHIFFNTVTSNGDGRVSGMTWTWE